MHYMASTGLLNERYLDELIIATTPEELLEALPRTWSDAPPKRTLPQRTLLNKTNNA